VRVVTWFDGRVFTFNDGALTHEIGGRCGDRRGWF